MSYCASEPAVCFCKDCSMLFSLPLCLANFAFIVTPFHKVKKGKYLYISSEQAILHLQKTQTVSDGFPFLFPFQDRVWLMLSALGWIVQMVVIAENGPTDKKSCENLENLKPGLNQVFPLAFCTWVWNSWKARVFKNTHFLKYLSLELERWKLCSCFDGLWERCEYLEVKQLSKLDPQTAKSTKITGSFCE